MENGRVASFAAYRAPVVVIPLKLKELKPKQLIIKVYSASINPVDFKRLDGMLSMLVKEEFPAGLCYDAAGIVEKVGSEVTEFKVGDRVCTRSLQGGTLADYCIADENVTVHLPASISYVDGAALPLAGQTALQSLRDGNLKEGQSILISGGAGGVGTYALQLAKFVFKAARVVTTCSSGKMDFCKSLGADECIDYTKENPFNAAKFGTFDMVYDTTGEAKKMGGSLIKPGGIVVSVASIPDPEAFQRVNRPSPGLLIKTLLFFGSMRERWAASPGVYHYLMLTPNSKDLAELVGYLSEGKIKSCIDIVYDGLDKSAEAMDRSRSGRAKGKIIVNVRTE